MMQTWPTTIYALVIRDYDHRFRSSKLAGVFIVMEPVFLIAIVSSLRVLFGTLPVYGPSVVTFHATGILPFQLFILCSSGLYRARLELDDYSKVSTFQLVTSRFIIEFLNLCAISVIFFAVCAVWGIQYSVPIDFSRCVQAYTLTGLFAFGVGLINSGIASYFPAWIAFYATVSRSFMLLSGVLFVVAQLPPNVRWWVSLNPLCHCIDLFRLGFYPAYPVLDLSISYLLGATVFVLVVGCLVFDNRDRQ